jgi:hypothetical protein
MCTATWLIRSDGYELFVNRDELRTRPPAKPPVVCEQNRTRYLSPQDPEGGGSWLAANEFGLSLCLLNHYPSRQTSNDRRFTSRGLLVLSLIEHRSPAEVASELERMALSSYRPFLLLVLVPHSKPLLLTWDGDRLSSGDDPQQPVSTSSFDSAKVIRARCLMFTKCQGEAFHFSRDPAGDAYSVCMAREDAQTVSFSRIIVAPERIDFHYQRRQTDGSFAAPIIVRLP